MPLLAATVLLTGCSGYQPAQQVRHGGTLVIALDPEPQSLNPLTAGDVSSVRAYAPLYPELYAANPDLSIRPELATTLPAVSPDGLAWSVPLRAGATWSDGQAITAADVVYTVTTESDPTLQGDASFDWSMLSRVEAVDSHTVRFTLHAPDASFGARLVTAIVPAHALSRYKPSQMATAFFNSTPSVSGGPYVYASRDTNRHTITYTANSRYYGGRPNIDKVVVAAIDDPQLIPSLLAQGQVLWAPELTTDAARNARQQFGVRVASYPELGYIALQCNQRPGSPTRNPMVRQALASAIDRDAVARAAQSDEATVLWGDVSPSSWAYDPAAATRTTRDVARARALMAQAGAPTPLQLDLLYPRGDAARESAAHSISDQARDAGFSITPRPLDPVALHTALSTGQFMLALTETGMSLDPDDTATLASDQAPPATQNGRNYGAYASARMDTLLAQERAAPPAQRNPLISAVQRLLSEDLPFIPLYAPVHHAGYNVTINGLLPGAQLDQDRDGAMYARWYLAA